MSKKIILLMLIIFYSISQSIAQLSINAQIRPRAEYRYGYKQLPSINTDPAFFISQRSRMNLDFENEKLIFKISLQDVRIWGDETQQLDMPSASIHEALAEWKMNEKIHLRVGRQELVYDDHRLFGNADWVQQARSHDAAVLKFFCDKWKFDFGAAYNQESENLFGSSYSLNNYKLLAFGRANSKFGEHAELSLIAATDGFQSASDEHVLYVQATGGGNFIFIKPKFNFTATAFYQTGHNKTGKEKSAQLASFLFNFTPNEKHIISAGADFLSGDDATDSADVIDNTFNTLYATNHKFYGWMDYFLNIPADTKNGGLINAMLKYKFKASKKVTLQLDYHNFSLNGKVFDDADQTKTLDAALGSEFDAVINYQASPDINFQLGYSLMFGTESMAKLKGGDSDILGNWGWAQINFSPILFTSKSD